MLSEVCLLFVQLDGDMIRDSLLSMALKQAAQSECRFRVGAVLAKGSRVLGQAPNRRRNAPWVDFRHATFHAEEALMRRFPARPGAVLYVARLDRRNCPALARPCDRCQHVLSTHGISLVHYTTADGAGTLYLSQPAVDARKLG
ncbi:hypothetical protein GTW63_18845 [Streptomyces sp. SID6137]|nr:hypothetical protein [Streptomyces sp. SID6139]MYR20369.1 hypothetical protein [Streptomyces sp. SID6137]